MEAVKKMTAKDRLIEQCETSLKEKGLSEDQNYIDRLAIELREIDAQAEHEYFLDLYDCHAKFAENDNNVLVPYLLGLVDNFDIEKKPVYDDNFEFPDIDIDYLSPVRDYLKHTWAVSEFGEEKVCNIANYTTFGIKSSLIDMARVHGKDRDEILRLTTRLGLKDDEGNKLTFDKALELHEELAKYCEENPDVAEAARKLLNRNRGIGQHAGGLIISSVPIDQFVPLVRGKDNTHASAWVEGLAGTDLQPVGLVKFDLLVITDLLRIVIACNLIKDRYGLDSICAKDNLGDWSDISYLNDPKALAMADEGRLKGIFQFDSVGIRNLVKMGGVTSFDDLPAYSSLFRPGPLAVKGHERYVERKRGREEWLNKTPKLLYPIVKETYGVLVYQEQIQKILNIVGGIPAMHTEKVRKAISKKKDEVFKKYKPMFIENGMDRSKWSKEQTEELFEEIEAWSGYGFNKSHAVAYSYISSRLLYLKSHYPLEFFCATLQCENKDEKIKEYKLEAERCGVELERLDLNKSGVNFTIVGDKIYIGFSNVKGIGSEIAQRIIDEREANGPFKDINDFLERFGTDTAVLKPLVFLQIFGKDSAKKWLFYEHFKETNKKRDSRNKRNVKSRQGIVQEVWKEFTWASQSVTEEFAQKFLDYCVSLDESVFKKVEVFLETLELNRFEDNENFRGKELFKLVKKYRRNVQGFEKKLSEDSPVVFEEFEGEGSLDKDLVELCDLQTAESMFYGFSWDHPLQDCPEYDSDRTFFQFEDDPTLDTAPVQVCVTEKPIKRISKGGKGKPYYNLKVEDAHWNKMLVTIWNDDYDRFESLFNKIRKESELGKGLFLQIKLQRPTPPFKSYTLDGPARHLRHTLPPPELDGRIIEMKKPLGSVEEMDWDEIEKKLS